MFSRRRSRVRPRDLSRFTTQLATMLDAGLPLAQALSILINQDLSPALSLATTRIAEDVHNGHSLSTGMRRSPRVFSSLYISLVQSGEVSGRLPATLHRLARYIERSAHLRHDVISAMIYPLFVIATAAIVSSFLLIFIIPSFTEIFRDLDTPLPLLTRIVMVISGACVRWLPELLILALILGGIAYRASKHPRWREAIHSLSLSCPLIGDLVKNNSLARVIRTLETTLEAGVPILQALEVSSHAAGNIVIEREISGARAHVAEGASLFLSMQSSSIIPPSMIEMLKVGELTGTLDRILQNIASSLESEVERTIEIMKQLLEPTLIATLGIVIGTLVLAMYLPVFSMGALFT